MIKLYLSYKKERLKLWKKQFEDLLGSPPKIQESTITPVKTHPNILPRTPASRRKREEDSDKEEGGTPSKKFRIRILQ